MIPKKIHYIWLGGKPLPDMVLKCMESWKKHCPDYEIIRWDESNLDLDINKYCRQAYDAGKYAFASDVLRYYVIKEQGGIYLDVDVELLKPLDELLNNTAFMGFEQGDVLAVAPGLIIGAEKNNQAISELLELYSKDVFIRDDGRINYETVCTKTTNYLKNKYGLKIENKIQNLKQIVIYSTEYFCPINPCSKELEFLTENTYSKHLYLASWVPKATFWSKCKNSIKKLIKKIIGKRNYEKLKHKIKGEFK